VTASTDPHPEGRLWGGRFGGAPGRDLIALSRSEPDAFELAPYDLVSSVAHSHQLRDAGILDEDQQRAVEAALEVMTADVQAGTLRPAPGDEDLFGFLERVLVERVGPVGGLLRAGRSRNDQAANDLRLYLRDHARRVHGLVLDLVASLLEQARCHRRTVAPGFTHLQPAQPVAFGHHLLAHCQALLRDVSRLEDWDVRASRSPLGAAALGGSPLVLHPEKMAEALGYAGVCANSIDAVSSRDVVAEFLFVAAVAGVDVSRLAEEVTLWVSDQFAWAQLDDAYATGSSIMPQKKNPDVAELARGKAARLVGDLTTLLTVMKGLPLAYDRDLSEDKRVAIDAVRVLELVLPAMAGLVRTLDFDVERLRRDATARFTLATEIADWLSEQGVPFDEAHEITGKLVRRLEHQGRDLASLDEATLRAVDPRLTADVLTRLTPEGAIERRSGLGATAFERVDEQLVDVARELEARRPWVARYRGPRFSR